MLSELIRDRNLPSVKMRGEMLEILQREEYGYIPEKPDDVTYEIKQNFVPAFCAGKASCKRVTITCKMGEKYFSFPMYATIPSAPGKHPFFILINFRPDVPDRYLPSEEIVDRGFATLSFCYTDVTSDDNDFTNGLAGALYENGERGAHDAGKIAMWAWAAQRVLDYAETDEMLDMSRACVCGHSRLGKTALLTGALDERVKLAYSNDSGCCGAALSRGKSGERVEDITRVFPQWFCKSFLKYACNEEKMPFDQHWLIASVAPRRVYVASAFEDKWADPDSELLSCAAASESYAEYGLRGLVHNDRLPQIDDVYHDGMIGYHLRAGMHYLSREDWNKMMDYVIKHMKG